jgi:hypothetical protein
MPAPALLDSARLAAGERIAAFLSRGLDSLPAELEALQTASTSGEERRILALAVQQVAPCRALIADAYAHAFRAAFDRKLRGAAPAAGEPSLDDLTLVDDAAIELEIALGRLVRKTVEEIEPEALYGIEARVGELAAGRLLPSAENPLGVEAALEALKRACDAVPDDGPVRMALANALQPYVAAGVRHAYREVNEQLAAAGVQPRLQYRVERARDVGVQAAGKAPGGAVPAGMSVSQALNLRDLLPVATGTTVDIAAVVGSMLKGAPEQRRSGARILSNAKGMLYQAAVATPVDPALLRTLAAAAAAPEQGGVAAVRALAPQASHPLDRFTGELVASVFDVLGADRELPETVRHELDRLTPAAFRAAMLDRSFFANPEHPARRFLGEVSRLAADPDIGGAPESAFASELRSAVEAVASAQGPDLGVYAEAAARVQDAAARAIEARDAAMAAQVAELERAERFEAALAAARAAIQARLGGRTVPGFIDAFLTGPWAEAIAAADAEGRSGDEGADRRLGAVDDLLWSLERKSAADVAPLVAMLPRLVRDLRRGAAERMEQGPRDAFFDQLMRTHAELLQQARRAEAVPAAPAPPRPRPARGDATLPYSAAMPALLPAVLSRGTIVEMDAEDGTSVRARLSWVSPGGTNYLFTSSSAPARALSREALMRLLASGAVRALEDRAPAVERAIAAVAG